MKQTYKQHLLTKRAFLMAEMSTLPLGQRLGSSQHDKVRYIETLLLQLPKSVLEGLTPNNSPV